MALAKQALEAMARDGRPFVRYLLSAMRMAEILTARRGQETFAQ